MKRKLPCALLAFGLLLGSARGAESSFPDVKAEDWFAPYVSVCVESGLMKGTDNGFEPEKTLTNGEAATLAARLRERFTGQAIPLPAPGESAWPWTYPYTSYLEKAIETLGGHEEAAQAVAAPVYPATRSGFMALLALAADGAEDRLPAINSITALPDTNSADVLVFYNAGILTGVDDYGTFAGDRTLTRSEAAAMMARLAEPRLRLPFSPLSPKDPDPSGGTSGGASGQPSGETSVKPSGGTSGQPSGGTSIGPSGGTSSGDTQAEAAAMMVNGQPVSLSELAGWITAVAYQTDMTLAGQYGSRLDLSDPDMAQAVLEQAQVQAAAQALMKAQADRLGCEVNSLAATLTPSPSQEELQSYVSDMGLLCAKHILVSDPQSAQAVLDGMKAKPTLDQFDALLIVFGADPGMASQPNGYLFGPGEMVPEFETGTQALKIGSYSPEPVQSTYGYHIIWRLDPLDHPGLLPKYRDDILEQYVNRWLREAEITADSQVISQLDMSAIYNAYLQALLSARQ